MRAVDVGVLVDNAVTCIVPDHFDGHIEFVFTAHTVAQRRHLRATLNCVSPHKHRNTGLYWIFQRRHALKRHFIGAFARTTVPPMDAHVTGQNREH
ncbi:hypothetical protein D3C72_1899190 [compost metagenome]